MPRVVENSGKLPKHERGRASSRVPTWDRNVVIVDLCGFKKRGERDAGEELTEGRPASTKVPGAATSSRGSDNAGRERGWWRDRTCSAPTDQQCSDAGDGAVPTSGAGAMRRRLARWLQRRRQWRPSSCADRGTASAAACLRWQRFGCEVRRCSGGEENSGAVEHLRRRGSECWQRRRGNGSDRQRRTSGDATQRGGTHQRRRPASGGTGDRRAKA
ncbi:hypothetical protein Scep_011512 [Stephania cephalantha]|uniref:Uncharacterized protein n=1 Tax=Stephania cephalantha TaxID=152367 RepID=A0AAP0JDE5_9MAGN